MPSQNESKKLAKNEGLKAASHFLRGTILEGLADSSTGAISSDDNQLTKFHGIYQQDDRDVRSERRKQKLEKAFSFMIRVRVPGGVATSRQWLELDRLSDDYANGTLKLTTRQAFQFHGVIKSNLKTTVREINETLLDTIAACGDVNRNVMCNPNPAQSAVHEAVYTVAKTISERLTPATRAYHEIWLDGEKQISTQEDEEPIYGKTYLPRKFKTVIAVPPSNDVDVFAHCLGFIAIVEAGQLTGFTITVGGGLGMTHSQQKTYPRLADVLGFCQVDEAATFAEAVMTTQRDYGDRTDRKHARLKYTVEDMGLEAFRSEVEQRAGIQLGEAKPFHFDHTGDRYGWTEGPDGQSHLTLFIQNGRVLDTPDYPMKEGLRAIAKIHDGDFRLTPNQNLIIGDISPKNKAEIERQVAHYGLNRGFQSSGLRLNSMACVALPTCSLALAESERYLPDLLTELEAIIEEVGLHEDAITIRSTGCPNGCARPYLGEIGLVGRSPGKYNLYLGAAFSGQRLNKLYKESLTHDQIVAELGPILRHYAKARQLNERFGDFVIRTGYVSAVSVAKTDWWPTP